MLASAFKENGFFQTIISQRGEYCYIISPRRRRRRKGGSLSALISEERDPCLPPTTSRFSQQTVRPSGFITLMAEAAIKASCLQTPFVCPLGLHLHKDGLQDACSRAAPPLLGRAELADPAGPLSFGSREWDRLSVFERGAARNCSGPAHTLIIRLEQACRYDNNARLGLHLGS